MRPGNAIGNYLVSRDDIDLYESKAPAARLAVARPATSRTALSPLPQPSPPPGTGPPPEESHASLERQVICSVRSTPSNAQGTFSAVWW